MERNKKSIIWGLAIIVLGILFLGNSLEIWGLNLFFDGWWTAFIIVPSVVSLFTNDRREDFMLSVLGIIVGVLLLMAAQDFIEYAMVWKVFVPFVIICAGVSLIIRPSFKRIGHKTAAGTVEYLGIFSGVEEKVVDEFKGASCLAIFGGVTLDLTNAEIKGDVVIDCVSVFGGVGIELPKGTIVKTSGISIFGGATNKFKEESSKKQPTVYVNHVSIFGGTELK